MNLKELKEKKADILDSMSEMTEKIEMFDSVKFEDLKKELSDIDEKIKDFDNAEEIMNKKNRKDDKKVSKEFYNKLMRGEEINLSQEIKNAGEHTTTNAGELIQETYADSIEKMLRDECVLYDRCRKVVTSSPYNIPVEKVVIDKFVPVAELGEYAKKQAKFGTVKVGAEKFGVMIAISQELLDDNDYNLEGVLLEQLVHAFKETVCELVAKGNSDTIQGLAKATVAEGAKEVAVSESVDEDNIIDLMFALPRAYRDNAVFVISDEMAQSLAKLRDMEGRPLLQMSDMDMPNLLQGADGVMKGKPVIICDQLPKEKQMFFVDLSKALVVGIRKDMQIKKSEEAGFVNDCVYIKANVRLDVKLLLQEAIAYIKITTSHA